MRLTCNGVAALHARVSMSAARGWSAELALDAPAFLTGRVAIEGGGATLLGTAWHAAPYRDVSQVLVVGGAGGLGKAIAARAYRLPTVRQLLEDIARDAREVLSPLSDPATLARQLPAWSRPRDTGAAALDQLADKLGSAWSVEDDGTIRFGGQLWTELALGDAVELHRDEEGRRATYGVESFAIRPGRTIGGRKVVSVDYSITSGTVRAEVAFERRRGGSEFDRFFDAMRGLVRRATAGTAFHATYAATVISQNADGTLELRLDTARVRVPGKVPVKGLPGVAVKVAPGARCHVSFSDGDETRPYAELFDPSSLTEITVTAATKVTVDAPLVELAGGGGAIARSGDPAGYLIPGSGGASWSPTNPGGGIPITITGGSAKASSG